MKTKNLNSPWITKEIKKSSRKKQRLYEKFLKNKTKTRLETYNHYKTFFEKMLKLVSAMFYQIFIFHHMIALSKL